MQESERWVRKWEGIIISSVLHETDREIARSRARSREQEAWLNLLPDDKEA